MIINIENLKEKIKYEIEQKKQEVDLHYQTLIEVDEYGWVTVFNSNTLEETIKSSFSSGRSIGEIEGEIYQLQAFLNYFSFALENEKTKED